MNTGHCFASKNELITWLKEAFDIQIFELDELSTGAIYCEMINQISPGSIPSHKINYSGKLPHECFTNFKLLQQAFTKNRIAKTIPVERLLKGFDHVEMLQWLKNYFFGYRLNRQYLEQNEKDFERSEEGKPCIMSRAYAKKSTEEIERLKRENEMYCRKLNLIRMFVETYPENPVTESLKVLISDN